MLGGITFVVAVLEDSQQRLDRRMAAVLVDDLRDLRLVAGLHVVQQPHHAVEPLRLVLALALALAPAALAVPGRSTAWLPHTRTPHFT